MAFNSVTFRVELDPLVKKELDHDFFVLEEWQSAEHKDDGTHGAITADSVTIAGDLTVGGDSAFTDIIADTLFASEITCGLLTVEDGASLLSGFSVIKEISGGGSAGEVGLSAGFSSNIFTTLFVVDSLVPSTDLVIQIRDIGNEGFLGVHDLYLLEFSSAGLKLKIGNDGVSGTGPVAVATEFYGDVSILTASVPGDFSINTNKFTVDGATGDTVVAGTSTLTGEVSLGGVLKDGTWPTSTIGESGRRWGQFGSAEGGFLFLGDMQAGVAANRGGDVYLGARGTTATQDFAYAIVRGARESAASGNFSTYFSVRTQDAAATETEVLRLTSAGVLRVPNLAGGGLVTSDGSGNLSMFTPGLTPGSFTTADAKTVSYNGDGIITSVV